jgi:hypothetical protein
LTMDISSGHGWPELCGFLGQPIPDESYPHQFKTSRQSEVLSS